MTTSKEIVGTSTVQPGDTVLWRLSLSVPSGDVQGIQFNDYFPLPVFDVDDVTIGIDTTLPLASNTSITLGPNDTAGLEPTGISVNAAENRLTIDWPDILGSTGEVIEVDVSLTVSSDPFADGLVLSNLFQAITDNTAVDSASGLNLASITLQEPVLEIVKTTTSPATQLEAGDTISFDITITNTGSAEAYDVNVIDTLPAVFTGCSLGAVTGGSGSGDVFAAGYSFTTFSGASATALDPGDSVTLPISCTLATTTENNSSYDNTASVVWAGQPGATTFPPVEDTASVTTRQTQSYKALIATSEAHTDDSTADTAGDPRPVVVGEIIRYRTWAYLPQGTLNNVRLSDLLPDGLEYVAGSETFAALVSDSGSALSADTLSCSSGSLNRTGNEGTDLSTLGLNCVVSPTSGGSGSGSDPVFNIGNVVNTETDANEELVVLELNARVVGDQPTGTALSNQFRTFSDNGSSTSAPVVAVQLAPDIAVDKLVTPNMADAEDTVEYTVTFRHSTTTGDEVSAFDVAFTDVIQAGLTYESGTGVTGPSPPASPGTDTCTAASLVVDDSDPSGAGITITFDALAPGDVCEVSYFASTLPGVVPGQTITNTAQLDYTSLPGSGTAVNPTGSPPGSEANIQSQDSATLTIDTVDISKTIVSTDQTFTTESTADSVGDPRPVAIGETITYRLVMRLPEGTAPDYQVTDLLPTGLAFVAGSARIAFVFDGAGSISATPGITCTGGTLNQSGDEASIAGITPTCGLAPSGGPFGSGADPIWDLGELTNTDMDADDEFVVIEFEATVLNELANQAGTALANSFELSVDGSANTSSSTFAEVVEPALSLSTIQVADPIDNLIDPTPPFSWDITLSNTGTATAFQIDRASGSGWQLILPVGVENINALTLNTSGNVFLNGTTTVVTVSDLTVSTTNNPDDTLTFAAPLQMDAGASLTIELDANLLASVEPGDIPSITEEVVYAGFASGSSASGIRDDADIASGSGNSPITSTTNLNDYRTEFDLALNTTPESPTLVIGKSIVAGPVNNGDGTFNLTYAMTLDNTGNVNLESVSLTDNLDTTFGAGVYSVDAVRVTSDSTSLTAAAGFTGAAPNTDLLTPISSTLPVTESGRIEIDLTVTPGANLGPLTNTAAGSAESARSTTTTSDSATVDLTFDEGAQIGLAKNVSVAPSSNGDGSYDFTYFFVLANTGDIVLDNLQITDLLDTSFAGASSFVVNTITSSDFTVDGGYDGLAAGTPTLLTGADSLNSGDTGTLTLAITVTPGANLGPYNNSATAAGDPPSNNTVTDLSDNGVSADGNGNGDPGDDSDPTPLTFVENPIIGIAKALSGAITNNGDGSYELTYDLVLENFGDGPLQSVQVTDNLATTFSGATSYTVDTISSADFTVNAGFNGSSDLNLLSGADTLAAAATGSVAVTVTVIPGANLGPYNNTATASGLAPGGTMATDASDAGTDPDEDGNGNPNDNSDPTTTTFTEAPEIGLAKDVFSAPTSNGDGSFTLTYRFVAENSGDIAVNSVDIVEDLASTFAAASSFSVDSLVSSDFVVNPGFNGTSDTSLLDGSTGLLVGASGSVDLTLTVTPGASLGPYNNSASISAVSSGGSAVTDDSHNGPTPDGNGNGDPTDDSTPTPVSFVENPQVGLAKDLLAPVLNNNDGTYTLTYRFYVENSGDSPLNSVQITDNLATTYAGASYTVDSVSSTDFTVNFPGFDGDGDQNMLAAGNTLATATTAELDLTITVTPGTNLGPYNNSALVSALSAAGAATSDTSDAGTDPDGNSNSDPTDDSDPTPVSFSEAPQIGLAKDVASGPINNLDGTYTLTYRLFLENSGDVPVNAIQIVDDLATAFADATSFSVDSLSSADFTVNFPGYDGDTNSNLLTGVDTLAAGDDGSIDLVVTVTPGTDLGPYDNSAVANATSSGGGSISDTSNTGAIPDSSGNGDPTDDNVPTSVTFSEGPAISVGKAIQSGPTNNNDGTYSLTYRLTVTNSGDTPLENIQVTDDLDSAFAGATLFSVDSVSSPTLTVNFPGFDGIPASDDTLLTGADTLTVGGPGASAEIDIALTVTPGAGLGPYLNTAATSGNSPSSAAVADSGSAPALTFTETPELGLAKRIIGSPTNNADGSYQLNYEIILENSGDVPLTAVQVVEDLSATFALADSFSVASISTSAGLTANPGFDGDAAGDTNLLNGTDTLSVGASETISVGVLVTPGATLGPYNNNVTGSSLSPANAAVTDTSTDGIDPDFNGNGDPSDDATPTQITFAESPEIGLAKALDSTTSNNDGTYLVSYIFTVENSGDVEARNVALSDDLASVFSGADAFAVTALSSAVFTVNPSYNGDSDTSLLAGSDILAAGNSGTVSLSVTVTPGSNLGPYNNSALLEAVSPGGIPLTDTSTNGLDPDSNGNTDPGDDSDVTPVTFAESPILGAAKAVGVATNNSDGTYTATYTIVVDNAGDVELRNLQVSEDLDATFAGAVSYVVDDVTSADFTVNFPGFNGSSTQTLLSGTETLAATTTGSIDLTVTVTPGPNLGPYNNSATAAGLSPAGVTLSDDSQTGSVADLDGNGDPTNDNAPTPLTFTETPQLGIAKQISSGPVNNADGTHTLTYLMLVENTGDVDLADLQIEDTLATTFTGATTFIVDAITSADFTVSTPYSGSTLLDGTDTLAVGDSGTLSLTVTVTPGGNLGPYNNTANVSATSPAGVVASDASDDSAVVDENGNGDPTDDNDPTAVTFDEDPVLGVAKALLNTPTNNGDGTYQATYTLTLTNTGDVNIENLNVEEDLASVFAGADTYVVDAVTSSTLTVNPAFTGLAPNQLLLTGVDTLNVAERAEIELIVTLTPGANLGPYQNLVTASGTTPAGAPINDDSSDGTEPDANGNGDPSDDSSPTPVTFSENALLGIAKAASASTPNFDGTFTTTVTLFVENIGDVVINNVEILDDIALRISPATVESISNVTISGDLTALVAGFDGISEVRLTDGSEALAVGETATITFDLTFRPNDNLGPFQNIASVNGQSPANPIPGSPNVTDDSTNGSATDPDGNGSAADNNEATPIEFVAGADGSVDITDESVPGEILTVTVDDPDENFDSAVIEQFTVVVVNDRTGESEQITLTETGPDTGIFTGELATIAGNTAGSNDDGVLNTQLDDTVTALYTDRLSATGSSQVRTDTGIVLGFAGLEGNAWLDDNINDSFDPGETPLDGWIIRVEQDGVLVTEIPVNPDGSYNVAGLLPGADYQVSLLHPDSGVTFGVISDLTLTPGVTATDQNLPIDPSGVFYDSVTRSPLADVTATMLNGSGTPLPAACFLPGQQDQISADDGFYRFDILPDADPACPSGTTYTLVFSTPDGYNPGLSALIPPQGSVLDLTGMADPTRIGDSAGAPSLSESTTYYVSFTIETGDPDFIYNHIPLDPFGVGGFSVRLNKEANQRTTSIGGLVSYTITLENLSPVFLPGISVVDSLPPGFSYVEDSAQVDGDASALTTTGTRPVTFAGIDLASGERRTLRYILRASVGLAHGEYVNTATPFIGPAQIGNSDTARIVVIADPDFEQTTVIGKVWHDRDGDGWQDSADAGNINVLVELADTQQPTKTLAQQGESVAREVTLTKGTITIDKLAGRYGLADMSRDNVMTLRSYYDKPINLEQIRVTTDEGSFITLTQAGETQTDHKGKVAAGLNSQKLSVEVTQHTLDVGYELRITITNQGFAEPGLPGVRLATVEGLLIETDAFGRYHIAGLDGGFMERGRNYIVKVDPATLPADATFTTENPRVKRLSQGLMNNFDFGVQLPELPAPTQKVSIKLAEMFFRPGSAEVLPGYMDALSQLAERIAAGDIVSIKIQAFVDPLGDQTGAKALAEQRALALRKALCDLLGRDVNAQIETIIDTQERQAQSVGDTVSSILGKGLDYTLQWIIASAQADCSHLNCQESATNGAFVVEDITPSVYAESQNLADQGRVDLVGEKMTRLRDGGVIWWTEDPANLSAALAVDAPSHIPVSNGVYAQDIDFVVYSNYAEFYDTLTLEVFHENDVDRRQPIKSFEIDTRDNHKLFNHLTWATQGEPAINANSLIYRIKATNADGLRDQTSEMRVFLIDAELFEQQQLQSLQSDSGNTVQVRPMDNTVVVFLPGLASTEQFEFRPQFAELGTQLTDQDKAVLDDVISQFAELNNINIDVVGHTSSEGIAKRSQHLFADNYALSQARAQVVAQYLATGLNQRVKNTNTTGMGADQPVADNTTEQGRTTNRRAEISMRGSRVEKKESVQLVNRRDSAISSIKTGDQTNAPSLSDNLTQTTNTYGRLLKRNDLVERRIPVYGSRIRINGSEIGDGYYVWLNGEEIPVDRNAKFAVEYLMPIGQHQFDLTVADAQRVEVQSTLPVDITGRYQFLVALADLTVSSQDISGSVLPLSGDERYEEDILTEGRLAFYLKGKVKGKYLITAQMDTREEQIDDLFSNIHKKDPDSLFRRLDPDRYYPVYGDDSTTVADVNTQGRMYVRLDWDRSEITWGNFETGFTGNELGQYSRGLYGAQATYESLAATEFDDSKSRVSAFLSESQTALGHSEFLGTGGSLYYLRHRDILPGSDKLLIEIRDPDTNRVIETRTLAREVDYEIDEIQGRIILSKPLLQVSQQSAPSLIVDGPLDGNVTVLMVDYEYLPDDFDANNLVSGVRGKQWLGDHVGIGATYVNEGRDAEDYQLGGVDLTLKAAQDTWMKLEWGSTESTQTERQFSVDGGLSFNNLSPLTTDDRQGDAYNVDVHINAGDFGGSDRWVTNAWFKEVDDHYSVARRDDGNNVWEYGAETQLPLSEQWLLGARASYFEVDSQYDLTEVSLQLEGKLSERGTLSTELKSSQENRVGNGNADALLFGLQYEHKITDRLDVYGSGQTTLTTDGNYQNNDQLSLGAKLAFSQDTSGQVEVRNGHRGNGLLGGLEHRLNSRHTIYGTATHSTDNTQDPFARTDNGASMLDNTGTNFAAGHRWALNDRANLFSEMQFSQNEQFSGVGEAFGLDYAAANGWHMGLTLQDGELTGQNGIIDRQAYSGSMGYNSAQIKMSTRLEYRRDQGLEDVDQWLTTNRFDYKFSPTYRLAAKLNYSQSDSDLERERDAKLIEGSLGLARRPVNDNRFNWLAKYTYLHDLQSFGQEDAETDQRSHIVSWEGIYKLNQRWDMGSKLARRVGELRLARNSGPWFESTVNFAALRSRWHVARKWDAMAEYRWLQQEEADNDRGGMLVTINRHIADNFKVGVGYNFTDFSDDLTDLDYDHEGWFVNLVGKY